MSTAVIVGAGIGGLAAAGGLRRPGGGGRPRAQAPSPRELGVGSVVRQALHPAEPAPRPSGYHALRGVSFDVGDRLGTADAAVYLGDGVEIGFARASRSAVYWYISLVDELAGVDAAAMLERC